MNKQRGQNPLTNSVTQRATNVSAAPLSRDNASRGNRLQPQLPQAADEAEQRVASTSNSVNEQPFVVAQSQGKPLPEASLTLEYILGLSEALQELPVSVVVVNARGQILFANRTLLSWAEQSQERVLESDFFETFAVPEERPWLSQHFRNLLAQDELPQHFICHIPGEKTARPVRWKVTPLRDSNSLIEGVMGIGDTADELLELRAEVQNSREQMALALEAANMASWSWEVTSDTAHNTESKQRILQDETPSQGLTNVHRTDLSVSQFKERIHPDDRAIVRKGIENSIASGAPLHIEFRIKRGDDKHDDKRDDDKRDDEWRWIESKGHVIRDESKRVVRIAGVSLDVTSRYAIEEALQSSQVLYEAVVNNAAEGIVVYDTQLRFRSWNAFMETITGFSADDVLGRALTDQMSPPQSEASLNALRRVLESGEPQRLVCFYRSDRTNHEAWLSGRYAPLKDARNQVIGVIALYSDITQERHAEEQLHQSNAILEATQEASAEGICLVDDHGRVVRFNKRFAELWGINQNQFDANDSMKRVLEELNDPDEFIKHINYLYDHPQTSVRDQIQLKDGRVFDRYSSPATTPGGVSYGRVWSFSDITERVTSQQNLEYQAFHDALTGLPNRALFMERLDHALTQSKRQNTMVAVLFLDLDRFKNVNDSLGHERGDQLLIHVAQRLQNCLREGDTAARLGGDEFVLLVENIREVQEAARIAERIAESFSTPFTLGGQEVFTSTCIGIALSKLHDNSELEVNPTTAPTVDTREDLLRDADAAMYRAKSQGRASYAIFDHAMNDQALEHLQLETDLRRALRQQQFELYFQPILNIQTRTISGVEALVRWNHPKRGLIPPDVFIPMAEETGLIVQIGQWVFREACRVARLWQDQFPQENRVISVNLSARQLGQPDLARGIARVLEEYGLPPHRLILEITESVLMNDAKNTIATLNELKDIGLFLSVDDFGTGYSSLSYLRRFPVSSLKIDRSFISGLGSSSEDTAIVRAIITLAEALGLSVVAEGVETAEQRNQLREFGCEFAQGFLFARPLTWVQLNETWDLLNEFAQ